MAHQLEPGTPDSGSGELPYLHRRDRLAIVALTRHPLAAPVEIVASVAAVWHPIFGDSIALLVARHERLLRLGCAYCLFAILRGWIPSVHARRCQESEDGERLREDEFRGAMDVCSRALCSRELAHVARRHHVASFWSSVETCSHIATERLIACREHIYALTTTTDARSEAALLVVPIAEPTQYARGGLGGMIPRRVGDPVGEV
jgi:hypothetical protein